MAAHARGALRSPRAIRGGARTAAQGAFAIWQQLGAPYLAARLRVLIGAACRALGDEDGAELELEAARAVFGSWAPARPRPHRRARRGARQPIAFGLTLASPGAAAGCHRQDQREIAGELSLSEKTVDRHVSNIFIKLDVPTRSAATAYAYQHKLI